MMPSIDVQREAVSRIEAWVAREGALRAQQGATTEWYESGNLRSRLEPDGSHTTYDYDEWSRIEAVHHGNGQVTRYRYGQDDRLIEIDSAGGHRRFEHDASGRLVVEHRGRAGGAVYRYDAAGRVAEFRTARVSTVQAFDASGRVVSAAQTIDGVTLDVALDFDVQGRLAELRVCGARIRYAWDARNRPARVSLDGRELARFEYVDAERLCRVRLGNGVTEESSADPVDARPRSRRWMRGSETLDRLDHRYDAAGRLESDGRRDYTYDARGWLIEAREPASGRVFHYSYDAAGNRLTATADSEARECLVSDAGELDEVRTRGELAARFVYDGKGRPALMEAASGVERYVYGPADELLAVTDAAGRPLRVYIRTPFGVLAEVAGRKVRYVHHDERGTRLFVTGADGEVICRDILDPFGLPLEDTGLPPTFGTRIWNPVVRLYCFGARWYDPALGRFLTPDTYTGGPDDARIVNALGSSRAQAFARDQLLRDWLMRPRNLHAFCGNDPVNAIDPNGHWSFGRVLLSLLGAIWTLPNTLFGLVVEITCLVGEVVRWIVYAVTLGNVSWATPGFDVAASGRLNAFALVFRGGWLGSFESLLGITFGNVFFVYDRWETSPDVTGPDVSPPAYGGSETIPRHDALYEHELRHTNQYGWFGPFFHLGLPAFGVYEWDVILHGYRESALEKDAREHGGI